MSINFDITWLINYLNSYDEVKELYKVIETERAASAALFLKNLKERKDPVAEFFPVEVADSEENQLRKIRNSKFDLDKSLHSIETISQFQLSEKSSEFWITYSLGSRIRPALPISLSKLVVIGKIVKSKAFLSNDKSAIYSEFTLKIKKILKQNTAATIEVSSEIAVIRAGGRARLPSGKMLYRLSGGYNMPEFGRSYLMFLDEDEPTKSFGIIAGYKFESGKIVPLDENLEQNKYKGYKKSDFIKIVKTQISNTK